MKKIFAFVGVIGLLLPTLVLASVFRHDQNVARNEVLEGNVYVVGNSPLMEGTIKGDLTIAGRNVDVTGNVEQDLLVAGANVNITGHIGGDIRAFAGEMLIDGTVDGEVLAFGGTIKIGPHAQIQGDMNGSGGTVQIDSGAHITGKQNLTQGKMKDTLKNGDDDFKENSSFQSRFLTIDFWVGQLLVVVGILLVLAIMFSLYPKIFQEIAESGTSKKNFWPQFGLGILLLIVTPIAAVLSMITRIGVLLGIILLIGYVGLILFSMIFGGVLVGALLYRWIAKSKKFAISWGWWIGGVVLLHLLNLIPWVGFAFGLVFFILACGTLIRTKWIFLRKA